MPWLLEISRQGTFLSAVPRMIAVTRGKKQVQIPAGDGRSALSGEPQQRRASAAGGRRHRLCLGRARGLRQNRRPKKAEKHHEAFITLIGKAAPETGDAALQSCVRFYANASEVERAREALKEAKAGTLVALSVGGAWWIARPCSPSGASIIRPRFPSAWRAARANA